MGLPASQHRVLGMIEHAISRSDPRLTSLFAMFSRLAGDEDMPGAEQLPAPWLTGWGALLRGLTAAGRQLTRWRTAAAFYPVAGALLASILLIAAMTFAGPGQCAAAAGSGVARHYPATRTCRAEVPRPALVLHR